MLEEGRVIIHKMDVTCDLTQAIRDRASQQVHQALLGMEV